MCVIENKATIDNRVELRKRMDICQHIVFSNASTDENKSPKRSPVRLARLKMLQSAIKSHSTTIDQLLIEESDVKPTTNSLLLPLDWTSLSLPTLEILGPFGSLTGTQINNSNDDNFSLDMDNLNHLQFIEDREYSRLSDRIGTNYTQSASCLTLDNISKIHVSTKNSRHSLLSREFIAKCPALDCPMPSPQVLPADNFSTSVIAAVVENDGTDLSVFTATSRSHRRYINTSHRTFIMPSSPNKDCIKYPTANATSDLKATKLQLSGQETYQNDLKAPKRVIKQDFELDKKKYIETVGNYVKCFQKHRVKACEAKIDTLRLQRILHRIQIPTPRFLDSVHLQQFNEKSESLIEDMLCEIRTDYYDTMAHGMLKYEFLEERKCLHARVYLPFLSAEQKWWTDEMYRSVIWRVYRQTGLPLNLLQEGIMRMQQNLYSIHPVLYSLQNQWLIEAIPNEWEILESTIPVADSLQNNIVSDSVHECDIKHKGMGSFSAILFTNVNSMEFRSMLPQTMDEFVEVVERRAENVMECLKTAWITAAAKRVNECATQLRQQRTSRTKTKERQNTVTKSDLLFQTYSSLKTENPSESKSLEDKMEQMINNRLELEKQMIQHTSHILSPLKKDTEFASAHAHENQHISHIEYFCGVINAAAVLMSRNLRYSVESSIHDFLSFFSLYSNPHETCNRENALLIFVDVGINPDESIIPNQQSTEISSVFVLDPPPSTICEKATHCLDVIVESSFNYPRIDTDINIPHNLQNNKSLGPCTMDLNDEFVQRAKSKVENILLHQYEYCQHILQRFKPYVQLMNGEFEQKLDNIIKDVIKKTETSEESAGQSQCIIGTSDEETPDELKNKTLEIIEIFRQELVELQNMELNLSNNIQHRYTFQVFVVSCSEVKQKLRMKMKALRTKILAHISSVNIKQMTRMMEDYETLASNLLVEPIDALELKALNNYYANSLELTDSLCHELYQDICTRVKFMKEFDFQMTRDEIQLFFTIFRWPENIKSFHRRSLELQAKRKHELEVVVSGKHEQLQTQLSALERRIVKLRDFGNLSDYANVIKRIESTRAQISEAEAELESIRMHESALGVTLSMANDVLLETLKDMLGPIDKLWTNTARALEKVLIAKESILGKIIAEDVKQACEEFQHLLDESILEFEKNVDIYSVALAIASEVKKTLYIMLESYVPLMDLLCTPAIRPRHWAEIEQITGLTIPAHYNTNINQLVALGLHKCIAAIRDICLTATPEHELEKQLDEMEMELMGINVGTKEYNETGTFILSPTNGMQEIINEQIEKTKTLRDSEYIKPHLDRAMKWETNLCRIRDILDTWMKVQVHWLHLEPIFSSGEFIHQMPIQEAIFKKVDSIWRRNMAELVKAPAILKVIEQQELPTTLNQSKTDLETIQVAVNDYLKSNPLQ